MANKKALSSLTTPVSNGDKCCLSEQINTSTRSLHTQLNRMIIAGLPLALPPYSSDHSMYSFGLLHIAPIYMTFESLWHRILDAPHDLHNEIPLQSMRSRDSNKKTYQAKPCNNRIRSVLSDLRLPDLLRSQRLRTDLLALSGNGEPGVDDQLDKIICQPGTLSRFIAHTTKTANENPHVLLAYAWVMYMALFSGGRYLHASLQKAGHQFWMGGGGGRGGGRQEDDDVSSSSSSVSADRGGLQFFHFVGTQNGEDIKREFKIRFAAAESSLEDAEKDDIVQEAQHIFAYMVELVHELTRVCALAREKASQAEKEKKKIVISSTGSRDSSSLTGDECPSTGGGTRPVTQNDARKSGDLPLVSVLCSGLARLVAAVSMSTALLLPRTLFKPAALPGPITSARTVFLPIEAPDLALAGFILLLLNVVYGAWYFGSWGVFFFGVGSMYGGYVKCNVMLCTE